MKITVDKAILQLISKKRVNKLNEAEQLALDFWLKEAPENQALYDNLIFIEDHQSELQAYKVFQTEKKRTFPILFIILIAVLGLLSYFLLFAQKSSNVEIKQAFAFLPDQTEVQLEEGSSLLLSENFNKTNRKLSLKGSGYFNVKSNQEKPFIIEHQYANIEVLGTRFHLIEHKDSLQLSVSSGLVRLSHKENSIKVQSNETIVVHDGKFHTRKHQELPEALINLEANHYGLQAIYNLLEKKYKVKFEGMEKQQTEGCYFNGKFENASIQEVMEEMSLLFGVKYSLSNNTIHLKPFNCLEKQ